MNHWVIRHLNRPMPAQLFCSLFLQKIQEFRNKNDEKYSFIENYCSCWYVLWRHLHCHFSSLSIVLTFIHRWNPSFYRHHQCTFILFFLFYQSRAFFVTKKIPVTIDVRKRKARQSRRNQHLYTSKTVIFPLSSRIK